MTEPQATLCMTCGGQVAATRALNRLPGGEVCPTCRERLLEGLPPLLPGGYEGLEAEEAPERAVEAPSEDVGDAEPGPDDAEVGSSEGAEATWQLRILPGPDGADAG